MTHPVPLNRMLQVLCVVAIAVAAVGYFTGVRGETVVAIEAVPAGAEQADPRIDGASPPEAPTYEQLGDGYLRRPYGGVLEAAPVPVNRTHESREHALARRAANRAYDGAPPVVPHPVDQRGAPTCLACHERGLVIEDRVAPRISHPIYPNCTQCHVVDESPVLLPEIPERPPYLDNAFVGWFPPSPGDRLWSGAPPTIPHETIMREACVSCHGELSGGLATSHLNRRNCFHCHVAGDASNQAPVAR